MMRKRTKAAWAVALLLSLALSPLTSVGSALAEEDGPTDVEVVAPTEETIDAADGDESESSAFVVEEGGAPDADAAEPENVGLIAMADEQPGTWAYLQERLNAGGTVMLINDYVATSSDGPLVIPEGVTVILDLYGHTINRNLTNPAANGCVILNKGDLTIRDTSTDGTGKITGGKSDNTMLPDFGGGISNYGTLTLQSGSITGNEARGGAGVFNYIGATFRMTGGTIIKNTSELEGAGVYNLGSFIMTDGIVFENTAGTDGGGVFTTFGGEVTLSGGSFFSNIARANGGGIAAIYDGRVTITGGSVFDNKATGSRASNNSGITVKGYGGGIFVDSASSLKLTGGDILSNTAIGPGSGIYVSGQGLDDETNPHHLTMSGSPSIRANVSNIFGDLFLDTGVVINVDGAFGENAEVDLASADGSTTITSGYGAHNTLDPAEVFADMQGFEVLLSPDGEVWLGHTTPINLAPSAAGVVTSSHTAAVPGETVTLTVQGDAIPFAQSTSDDGNLHDVPIDKGEEDGIWTFVAQDAPVTVHVRYRVTLGTSVVSACNMAGIFGGTADGDGLFEAYGEPGEVMGVQLELKDNYHASILSYEDGESLVKVPFEEITEYESEYHTTCASFTMPAHDVALEVTTHNISNGIHIVDRDWFGSTVREYTYTRTGELRQISGGTLASGWYYVASNQTVSSRIVVPANAVVNIILIDDTTLTAKKGIEVQEGGILNIYGQDNDTGTIISTGEDYCAGIGGYKGTPGIINLRGGTIQATGGKDSAGIGGGGKNGGGCNGGVIRIYGGTVKAYGSHYAAGIGGGNDDGKGGDIGIYGGNVTATGGADAAGIGGGEDGNGGTINITGGKINVTAGENAAGIGGGENGDGGNIDIRGGIITVKSEDGAAIGGAEDGDGGTTNISGGTLDLRAYNGAGIGGGNHSGAGGTINISGGDIKAHATYGAGIGGGRADSGFITSNDSGDGGNITITGGTIDADSTYAFGIGAGGNSKSYEWDSSLSFDHSNCGDAGTIRIEGGYVIASSGYRELGHDGNGGPGGIGGDGGKVTITGGRVEKDEESAGSFYLFKFLGEGDIKVSGGTVYGYHVKTNGTFTIEGGMVELYRYVRNKRLLDADDLIIGDDILVRRGESEPSMSPVKAADRVSAFEVEEGPLRQVRATRCNHPNCSYDITETTHKAVCEFCLTHIEAEPHNFEAGICKDCGYDKGRHILTIDDGNGNVSTVYVPRGETAERPSNPKPKAGYVFADWYQVVDGVLADTPFDFENTLFNENITIKAVYAHDFGKIEYSASLTLEERIGVNLYVKNLPEGTEPTDYTVRYWTEGDESSAEEAELTTTGTNYLPLANFAAKEMCDQVHVRVYHASQAMPLKLIDYSVRDYCDANIGGENERLSALCQAVLDYGTYAQQHFGYGADDLANANHSEGTEDRVAAAKVPEAFKAASAGACSLVSRTAASVSLDSQVSVNLYLTPAEGATAADLALRLADVDLSSDGVTEVSYDDAPDASPFEVARRTLADGRVYVQVNGLAPVEYDRTLEFAIGPEGDAKTVSFSVLSYAHSKQSGANQSLAGVCRALYNYHLAAEAYMASRG